MTILTKLGSTVTLAGESLSFHVFLTITLFSKHIQSNFTFVFR